MPQNHITALSQSAKIDAVGVEYVTIADCWRIVSRHLVQAVVDGISSEWKRNIPGLVLVHLLKFESIFLPCGMDLLNFLRNITQQKAAKPE